MLNLQSVSDLHDCVRRWQHVGERIALVPTMGNLHAGHIKLVAVARAHATRVAVSVFVNPLQFGPHEDYRNYPRTLDADAEKLQGAGTDLLFAPAVEEMYPRGQNHITRVEVPELSGVLEGEFRRGHFAGVATVVLKLFGMARPDVALFGEKDYQQLLVIRRLAADLSLPVEIIGVPTVREADGLAMSSRNQYLTATERQQAPRLYRTLAEVGEKLRAGQRDFSALEAEAARKLAPVMRPDYIAIRNPQTLAASDANAMHFVVLAAAWLGKARLIDNLQVRMDGAGRDSQA